MMTLNTTFQRKRKMTLVEYEGIYFKVVTMKNKIQSWEPTITPLITVTETGEVNTYVDDKRDVDQLEERTCDGFFKNGCGCTSKCSSYFDEGYMWSIRNKTAELSQDELDLLIMGELLTSLQSGPMTSALKYLLVERRYTHTIYYHKKYKMNS